MKRLILACAASALAFSVICVASASASASSGASTHFTAGYPGTPGTFWSCSGNHIVSNGAGAKDTETCVVSGDVTGYVAGTYKSDPSLGLGTGGCAGVAVGFVPFLLELDGFPPTDVACWFSDFNGAGATKWTMSFSHNGTSPDTWTLSLVAYYNG
jgi:hypothetical protein